MGGQGHTKYVHWKWIFSFSGPLFIIELKKTYMYTYIFKESYMYHLEKDFKAIFIKQRNSLVSNEQNILLQDMRRIRDEIKRLQEQEREQKEQELEMARQRQKAIDDLDRGVGHTSSSNLIWEY